MRILILANNDIGLYKFRRELLEELLKNNEVFIALPYGEFIPNLQAIGCQYIPFEFNRRGMNPFADLWQIHRYRKQLRQSMPNVVLTYTIKPNIYGGIACQKEHIPYIANVTGLGTSIENGGILSRISLALYRKGLHGAKCVFFQNEANLHFFEKNRIIDKEHAQLIPGSGVNLNAFPLEPYPDEKNGIRFLFVGRIMRDKGIGELLQAMTTLHRDNPMVTLDIVGDYDELEWRALIKETELAGAARYHGPQPDVRPFYKNCHCVVLPSYHEGMANVLLEASATGRPVIASRIAGCRETFDEAISGFGCTSMDAGSLIDTMKLFLSLTQEQHREMGIAAHNKMTCKFNRQIVINKYLQQIEEAVVSQVS